MCATCGCSDHTLVTVTDAETGEQRDLTHEQAHALGLAHTHAPDTGEIHWLSPREEWQWLDAGGPQPTALTAGSHGRTIALEQEILSKNQLLAERNRGWLADRGILALNLVSSPGSGKTSLLERTLLALKTEFDIAVIEGDQETLNDAERIRATGCRAVQINTGAGCHLEADMLGRSLESLRPAPNSLLFIENVGNLVCPAMFDLGERAKVAILSVTEGEDKPLKYPHMFRASELMLLNKIDLLPYLKFDLDRCLNAAREVNPRIEILLVSAVTGEGMNGWHDWLRGKWREVQARSLAHVVMSE